jgi:hypothetical protein
MDTHPDNIIKEASKEFKRTEIEKFDNHFLEQIYQSIIPIHKLLK